MEPQAPHTECPPWPTSTPVPPDSEPMPSLTSLGSLLSAWGTCRAPRVSCPSAPEPPRCIFCGKGHLDPAENGQHFLSQVVLSPGFSTTPRGGSYRQAGPHSPITWQGCPESSGRRGTTEGHALQLRTHRQGQHVGEHPCAVEHQVELRGRHPAEHGGRHGPKLPLHFFLQSPESRNHSESEDRSD